LKKKRKSRRVRLRAGVVAAAALAGGLMWVGVPRALARVAFFRVREIDLVGVKYLAPDALITALRLPARASVFDDARLLADRVKGVNGVSDATVQRRLPGTLKILVTEVEPAAFAPAARSGKLVAVDARGRPLPFDPERTGLDLPVVARADSGVVSVLALVQAVDPALFQRITGARSTKAGDVLLEEADTHRVLLRRDAGPDVIRAVVLVGQDLAATGRDYAELDARFAGQVVVRQRAVRKRGGA
jgi:cell division septal protein FtsQ